MSDTTNSPGLDNPQDPSGDDMYLDRPLKEYARSFSYPPTPDIAASVRERLGRERSVARGATLGRPRLAWVIAALVVVSLVAALLTPDVQAFVRYILRIGNVEIIVATPTPTAATRPGTPLPTQLPTVMESLVGRTTLPDAVLRATFPMKTPRYPADLGPPDLIYLQDSHSMVVFAWLDHSQPGKVRLSLIEFLEGVGLAQKIVSNPEVVEETTVNGQKAAWVRGPHYLLFRKPDSSTEFQQHMLVEGNVLLWKDGAITFRLETDLSKEEAIKIAESLVELPPR
ncbi:MAG: hypothetical protein QOH93_1183 [Chloroflexia bacterium]|jgi:hypothetical protein|nr:hypothetical protein [Chloroflexia bacterium]